MDEIAPIKSINTRIKANSPWYDDELVRFGIKRDRLFNKHIKSGSVEDRRMFTTFRNIFKSLVRKKRATYYSEMIDKLTVSSSKLWKRLSPFLNPNKKAGINHIDLACGNPQYTRQDMVNAFSNYFSSILSNTAFCNLLDSRALLSAICSTSLGTYHKLSSRTVSSLHLLLFLLPN